VLSNELGDGRVLTSAPSLTNEAYCYSLICAVAPGAPRVDAQKIGSAFATNPETDDCFADTKRSLARVSGIDYLPQRVREVLSMQRGESLYSPTSGMRFFEYFEVYRGSPWLDLLLKLDVVRQASIPSRDNLSRQTHTPLRCVTRVRSVKVLADTPTNNRLPVHIDLEVQGLGPWTRELSIYMPTAEQMAERAKMLADTPWLAGVFLRLILVEEREDLPHHHAHRIFPEILRDADKPDARLAQAAYMHLQREVIPGEPAEGMNKDDIERRIARGGQIEQTLQFRAAVVRSAHAGFDEFYSDVPAAGGAISERLPPLVRDRQVGFRLPPGRDAKVERGTQGRFGLFGFERDRHLMSSSA
jgi:hypothetical protein